MKVLFVDDNQSILSAFKRNLRKRFEIETVDSAELALVKLQEGATFDVIVSDMKMPGINGVEFLERAADIAPDTVRIMLTGNADQETAIDAVNRGHVYRFLNKPCSVEQLIEALEDAASQHKIVQVESKVMEETLAGCVEVLADVLGLVAPFALGRGQRLRDSISPFAEAIKLKAVWKYEVSALLSSIGCTSLPFSLLQKLESKDELSENEASLVNDLPEIGYDLVSDVPKLDSVALIIKYHKKNYDGSGYPNDGVRDDKLPLGARILKIFNERLDLEGDGVAGAAAKKQMNARKGRYDPKILELCFKYYPEYLTASISKGKPVDAVRLEGLKPGQVIVSDITTNDGILLVEAGNRLTGAIIRRICNYSKLGQIEGPFYVQKNEEG